MLKIKVTWICSFTLTDDVIILVRSSYGEMLDYFRFKMDIHCIWHYFLLIKEFSTDIFLPYWPYLFFLVCSIFELGHWMFKFGLLSGTDFTKIAFFFYTNSKLVVQYHWVDLCTKLFEYESVAFFHYWIFKLVLRLTIFLFLLCFPSPALAKFVPVFLSLWCLWSGVWRIAPEENCPSVRVRVWFRISVRIRAGRQFSSGSIFLEPFEVTIIVCYLMHVSASRMLLQETFLVLKIIGMTHNDNQELSMHFQHPDA